MPCIGLAPRPPAGTPRAGKSTDKPLKEEDRHSFASRETQSRQALGEPFRSGADRTRDRARRRRTGSGRSSSSTRARIRDDRRRISSSSANLRASSTSIGTTQSADRADRFDALWDRVCAYLSEREAYCLDCYVGADERYRVPFRVYTELAWHSLFARHLFITPERPEPDFAPEFTVVDAALFAADPQRDGTRTGTFILVNFERRIILIGGTRYAGEIKKSVFTVMNYLLPLRETLPMHCSANVGEAVTSPSSSAFPEPARRRSPPIRTGR